MKRNASQTPQTPHGVRDPAGIAKEGPARTRFLHRLQGEIAKRGVIDEAHSSQGGRTMAKMHMVLSKEEMAEVETVEDAINIMIAARKLLPNASYFAFTEELPAKVAADRAYQNAQERSDKNAARIEHDRALRDSILAFLRPVHNVRPGAAGEFSRDVRLRARLRTIPDYMKKGRHHERKSV